MIVKAFEIYRTHKEKILYLIFGGFTTLIYYGIFFVLHLEQLLNQSAWFSNIIAQVIAVAFAFITNKLIVFESKTVEKSAVTHEVVLFIIARLITLGVTTAITFIFVDWLGLNALWQTFTILTVNQIFAIVFNYFASKYFIFNRK